mgnify:CR=1 FL=1
MLPTEEEILIRDMARQFAQERLKPFAADWDREHRFPAEAIAEMEDKSPRPLFLIAGMLSTKDPVGFFEAFAGMARHVFTVPLRTSDAGLSPDELADAAYDAGLDAEPCDSVEQAIRLISTGWSSRPAPRIVICGSLYLAGEVLKASGLSPR